MDNQSLLNTLDIHIIKTTLLAQFAKKPKHTIFAVTLSNINKALTPKKHTNSTIKVPLKHYKYLITFLQKEANILLKRRPYNHKIIIKKGKHPRFGPLYKIS